MTKIALPCKTTSISFAFFSLTCVMFFMEFVRGHENTNTFQQFQQAKADSSRSFIDRNSDKSKSGLPTRFHGIHARREHSLSKPYQGTGVSIPYWNSLGNTMISSDYVRLTADIRSQQGAIWNSEPLDMVNWEVQVEFKVTGSTKSLYGDGLAFWYAKDRLMSGPVFGSKDHFSGLAVFLDTYSNHNGPHNHEHPYISAMLNNGSKSYDHDKDGTHTVLGKGCHVKFRNKGELNPTYLAVRYENDILTVSTDVKNGGDFEICLQEGGVLLPPGYFIGLSASTGDLTDAHDIISVKVYDLDNPLDYEKSAILKEQRRNISPSAREHREQPERPHTPDDPKSGISKAKLTIYLLLGSIILCILAVAAYLYYHRRSQQMHKRFY